MGKIILWILVALLGLCLLYVLFLTVCALLVDPQKERGISHGDMIDLTRKNIPGFDVAGFYIGLVRELKAKGL